jgi:hypothetical protein
MRRSVVILLDLPDAAYGFRITLPYAKFKFVASRSTTDFGRN